jgi:hypothetical protein
LFQKIDAGASGLIVTTSRIRAGCADRPFQPVSQPRVAAEKRGSNSPSIETHRNETIGVKLGTDYMTRR